MFKWITQGKQAVVLAGLSSLCAIAMTGCSSSEPVATKATPQGTIDLSQCKVGMPESTLKDALLTFVPDTAGRVNGKVQYISRGTNADGGQYLAQCKKDRFFEIQVIYNEAPVTKEVALKALHDML